MVRLKSIKEDFSTYALNSDQPDLTSLTVVVLLMEKVDLARQLCVVPSEHSEPGESLFAIGFRSHLTCLFIAKWRPF